MLVYFFPCTVSMTQFHLFQPKHNVNKTEKNIWQWCHPFNRFLDLHVQVKVTTLKW